MESAFNTFCFESNDSKSLIINFSGLIPLKQLCTHGDKDIIKKLVDCANQHMLKQNTPHFIFHLFCNGMVLKDMVEHRKFMVNLAIMFKDTFPTQLHACYVHHAPIFFKAIYEILQSIIPKSSRNKIIMLPIQKYKKTVSTDHTDQPSCSTYASVVPLAIPN